MLTYEICEMSKKDWEQVKNIYLQGINTGNATFECDLPTYEEWDSKHLKSLRLVAKKENTILGWIALSPVSGRCVYDGVTEVSIYIHQDYQKQGIGNSLMTKMISQSENENIWTLQAGIFPENIASLRLHEKCGFRKLGIREKIGKMKDGRWRDVVLMERRSRIVGTD